MAGTFLLPESFSKEMPAKQLTGVYPQNGVISGIVTDVLGSVSEASVIVKGTTNGIITDGNGKFTLDGIRHGDIIQISFIGYVTQEVTYSGQSVLRVDLREDSQALNEVIVIGYGTPKKVYLTGAVAPVSAEDIKDRV